MRVPDTPPFCRCRRTCATVDRDAIAYYFNGLSGKRRAWVRAHLSQCARCRVKLDVFATVWVRHGGQTDTD